MHLQELLQQLQSLLANDDSAAKVLLEKNAAALQTALGDAYQQIARDIDNFDFDEALAKLREKL